jgi:hypothetical protein
MRTLKAALIALLFAGVLIVGLWADWQGRRLASWRSWNCWPCTGCG